LSCEMRYPAGGITSSDGRGIKVLSMNIRKMIPG
jgi:hypothetical protein